MSSRRMTLALAAVAVASVTATAVGAEPSGARRGTTTRGFVITGHVAGLYPGARRRLVLTIRNPRRSPLRVVAVDVRVGDAPECTGTYLHVGRFRGALRVPRLRTRRLVLRATMRADAPASCQGARFPLRFRGRGIRP